MLYNHSSIILENNDSVILGSVHDTYNRQAQHGNKLRGKEEGRREKATV